MGFLTPDRPSPDPPAIGKTAKTSTTGVSDADPGLGSAPVGRRERLFVGLILALAVLFVAVDDLDVIWERGVAE